MQQYTYKTDEMAAILSSDIDKLVLGELSRRIRGMSEFF